MEMNVNSLQVTSHSCSDYQKPPFASQSWACDHSGSPEVKFGNGAMNFGPSSQYTIDSRKPFEFRMDFPTENGVLKGHITVSQHGKQVRGTMHNLENMRKPLTDGMVLVLDAWQSEDMTWLDGGASACHAPETCNLQSTKFYDLVIKRLSGPAPAPAPSPNSACPGQGDFDCAWAERWGCHRDDGTEGFCRCCCERTSGSCKWSGR